ncbi:MAG: hypothetical protein RLZZ241_315 [Bacteroidota bacterium]|jgi:hypothetical protein
MSFLKRFGYYLIGLSIGLIFLAIFLRKKSESTGAEFCYLPNCRVLKSLRSKPIRYSESIGISADTTLVHYLLAEGDVIFSSSQPREKPCGIFVVQGESMGKDYKITLRNCEEFTEVTAIASGKP